MLETEKRQLMLALAELKNMHFDPASEGIVLNSFEQIAFDNYQEGLRDGLKVAAKLVEGWETADA